MPITLVTGPANAGKAEVVMDAVRGHLAHGAEPLLVVPTRADAEHYLRELAGEQTAMGVRVERFAGLIAEAVRRAGISDPLLGPLARDRALRALAARAGHPSGRGFARALGELIAELQVRRIAPSRFSQALSAWRDEDGGGAAPEQIASLFADYSALLARSGRLDVEQRAVRALDALRTRPALWGRTPVLLYGFDDLTALQLDTIETLGKVVDAEVTVALAYEPGRIAFAGRAAAFHALEPLSDSHRQLAPRAEHYAPRARGALSHLERSLFEPQAARVDPAGAIGLLEGGGERAELELVAAQIRALLDDGMAAEQIAVLARGAGTSLELLEEVFFDARIPFACLRRTVRFADTSIGGALVGLLRCVPGADGATAGQLGDLLAWLRAPGALERVELADALEVSARRQGMTAADRARALWEERHWPLETIDRLGEAQRRGPRALLERATSELARLFCAPRRASAGVLAADELAEGVALAAGRAAMAELRELAHVAPALAPESALELARVLAEVELDRGRAGAGDSVAVLDPLALRARRVRALFVCGLQEGAFPARARPHGLLGEDERRRLAEAAGLRLGEQQDVLAAERYLLYAAVSRPQQRLVLSWHVADDDGQPCSRSLFVDDVLDLFAESLAADVVRRPLGAVDGAVQLPGAAPSAVQPLREERLLSRLRERVWSASSLEKWLGCPVRWFVEGMLEPAAFEPRAEPLARGGLAHAALKDTLEGLRGEFGTARITSESLGRARQLLAAALEQGEAEHPLSVAPERRVAVRRRLAADLERYLAYAAESASPLEPAELELGFGFAEDDEHGEGSTLPALELGGGVRLRGRIDRIDLTADGRAVVYDYKGGSAPPAARWRKDRSLQAALYMRAVEQLLGRTAVGGLYQPLTGTDLRARGVIDAGSGLELDCVSGDEYATEELRELVEQAVAAALQVAAEAGRGELEPRPQTCAFRGGCMYPTICRCER